MRKYALPIVAVLVLSLVLVGCSALTFKRDTYRSLVISANVYEAGMASLADLHAKGLVTDEQVAKVMPIAEGYWAAYHAAVEALEGYAEVDMVPEEGKAKIQKALEELAKFCGDLIAILNPILLEHGETPLKPINL